MDRSGMLTYLGVQGPLPGGYTCMYVTVPELGKLGIIPREMHSYAYHTAVHT